MLKLVMLRHGQSTWNKENKFTGWTDVNLTRQGINEARQAGRLLLKQGYQFDKAYTSVLKRAIKTLWISLEEMDIMWLPIEHSWKLNERHYGALQGLDKSATAKRYGEDQVKLWRRSYDVLPPALSRDDKRYPKNEAKYQQLSEEECPITESLKTTSERVLAYWNQMIVPDLKEGKRLFIVAHGNSLRALVKHLDKVSNEAIVNLNIPTGIPLVYELNKKLEPIKHYYLGDQEAIQKAIGQVAAQGKAK